MVYKRNCVKCQLEFETYKKTKKYCSHSCFANRFNSVKLICQTCNNNFTVPYRFRGQKTCNVECAKLIISKALTKRVIKQCLYCNSEFEVTQSHKDKGKYCSLDCFYKHKYKRESKFLIKICEGCGKEFKKTFIQRNIRFCSRSCAHSADRNGMFGQPGPMTGKKSWNNGLTTEADLRVFDLGRKISERAKKQFIEGKRSNKGERNPNFGNTADIITKEKRENFSKAAIKRVLNGVSGYKTGHVTGTYVPKKSENNISFKSSWELAVMMSWDHDENIKSYIYEPETVTLSDGRRAIPDFIVTYVSGLKEMIEIKPTKIQEIDVIKQKLQLVREQVEKTGMKYTLYGDYEIKYMIKQLGDLFKNEVKRYKNRE